MRTYFVLLFGILLGIVFSPSVRADAPAVDFSSLPSSAVVKQSDRSGAPHPVVARLLTDKQDVQAGRPFRLGVHLTMQDKWHTYWRSPGGVGKKTLINWQLPSSSKNSSYVFPIPHRYFDGASVSYGYEDEVLLFTEVILPEGTQGSVELGANVEWLVCKTSCIMGKAELKTLLNVTDNEQPSSFAALFDHYAAKHPTPLSEITEVTVSHDISVSKLHSEESFAFGLSIKPNDGDTLNIGVEKDSGVWPFFAPIVEGMFDHEFDDDGILPLTSLAKGKDGSIFVRMPMMAFEVYEEDPLPLEDQIGGLLQLEINGKKVWTEVVHDVVWERGESGSPYTSELLQNAESADPFSPPTMTEEKSKAAAPAKENLVKETEKESVSKTQEESSSLILMLAFAFVGGLILNVMPCVLPVLTFKIYSMVEQQNQTAAKRRLSGMVYSAGVVLSFVAFALVVIFAQELFGHEVRWGFQNQSPIFTMVLSTICFLFGLSLFGVFEVPAFGASEMDQASAKDGLIGYFLTGVFTTLIATPCSAPFLGTGMAFAFELPPLGVIGFFVVAGLGLASPFLLAAFVPAASKLLPRPGAWMERFKQFMGFTLIATTAWLISALPPLVGSDGVSGFLYFLVVSGFGAWLLGAYGSATTSFQRQLSVFVGVCILHVAGAWTFIEIPQAQAQGEKGLQKDKIVYQWNVDGEVLAQDMTGTFSLSDLPKGAKEISVQLFNELSFDEEIPWQKFSEEAIDGLVGTDYTIFIDFTADWCASCKVNEKTILETEAVRSAMKTHKVWPMKADNTKHSELINRWLKHFKSAGVPLYLVIPAKRGKGFDNYESSVINLGEFITQGSVIDALKKASSAP